VIVTHEVTNTGSDRSQLAKIASQAKDILGADHLDAVADRGYFNSPEILACEQADITVTLPKPMTSGAKSDGRFGKRDFVYVPTQDVYRCPAGEKLTYRYTNEEDGKTLRRYWTTACWWPAWHRIREMWGDLDPNSIEFAMMSRWRAALEKAHGRGVAHKTLRVWRSLWTIMQGMKMATGADPSRGVRNRAPAPRYQRWSEGEAVQLVKGAWRHGYRRLACIIAVSWDSQFSTVDVRTLCERHRAVSDGRLVFDRQAEGRAKTGRAAIGTVSRRTERLVSEYFAGTDRLPDVMLFRMRGGSPYREATLAHDFAAVRAIVFPGDQRRLMDMRRSGTIEAVAGGADAVGIAAKMANSIGQSNALHKAYSPVSIEAVRNTDAARLQGRRKMRAENGKRPKV
jgi:hypothetical protein